MGGRRLITITTHTHTHTFTAVCLVDTRRPSPPAGALLGVSRATRSVVSPPATLDSAWKHFKIYSGESLEIIHKPERFFGQIL